MWETAASIKAKFDGLPDALKQRFKDMGNQLITVEDSVADAYPSLAGKTAPGWGKVTWDKIPGGFIDFPVAENGWNSPRALVVALSGKYGSASSDVFSHEFGHSIDIRGGIGVLSSAPLFGVARSRDFYGRNNINPHYKVDSREHFAEGFARYYNHDKSLRSYWPENYDYMKNLPKCLNSNGGCQ